MRFPTLALAMGLSALACGGPLAPATPALATPAAPPPPPAAEAPAAATPAVAPGTCNHPGLVAMGSQGRRIGSLQDLAAALGKSASNDEEAVKALCPFGPADTCNAAMTSYFDAVPEGDATSDSWHSLYVRTGRAGNGPWVAFDKLAPYDTETSEASRGATLDEGRYQHFRFVLADLVSGYQCAAEGGCELDSETVGTHVVDVVIDREQGRHAWSSYLSVWEPADFVAPAPPSFNGGTFARSDASGKADHFTFAELAVCTPQVFAAYAKDQKAAREPHFVAAKARLDARAKAVAGTAPSTATGTATAALTQGRNLTAQKQYDAAIAAFSRAIDLDTELLEALSGRCYARILRNQGDDLTEAINDCDSARTSIQGSRYETNKRFIAALDFNVGLAFEKKGDFAAARAAFDAANRRYPSDAAKKKLAALAGK